MADRATTPVELLARLVAFDTTSHRSNLELVDFVRDFLAGHGVEAVLVFDETGEKAALHATIGPNVAGGVVLSAHSDVVPVDGQDWSSDPFTLTRRGGRLHARGSADMKGFIAAVLAMVPEFAGASLARPVHIALSYDEEVGCLGVRPLSKAMARTVPMPEAVIVGEPTGLRPVDTHKSGYRMVSEFTGREAHSSVPDWGVNAVYYASRFVAEIERLGQRLIAEGGGDARFEPPHASVNVGVIAGGTAHNIVPRSCSVTWGIRGLPQTDVPGLVGEIDAWSQAELAADMRARAPEAGIETQIVSNILPLPSRPQSPASALIAELTGIAEMGAVAYGTDGGFFDEIGWPTVVCGPGNIEQAHRPDEFIDESEIAGCTALLRRLRDRLSA